MLDMGFIRDIRKILAVLPPRRQNLLFSATFSDEIRRLADGLLDNPAAVQVTPRNTPTELVTQVVHMVDRDRKRELLSHLIKTGRIDQALVFTRTKHGANRLAHQLGHDGILATAIHGNKSQPQRVRALADFKAGRFAVLVATEVAARGLDIEALPHVVNFELPMVPEDYVHRIGRTGRAGVDGDAVSLVCVDELKLLNDIERVLGRGHPARDDPGLRTRSAHPTRADPARRARWIPAIALDVGRRRATTRRRAAPRRRSQARWWTPPGRGPAPCRRAGRGWCGGHAAGHGPAAHGPAALDPAVHGPGIVAPVSPVRDGRGRGSATVPVRDRPRVASDPDRERAATARRDRTVGAAATASRDRRTEERSCRASAWRDRAAPRAAKPGGPLTPAQQEALSAMRRGPSTCLGESDVVRRRRHQGRPSSDRCACGRGS